VTAILRIDGLAVSFDGLRAVDGLNFSVDEDELRCVIGPNGAGKTTLLDMICGKTKPTEGTIRFEEHDLAEMVEYEVTRLGVGRKFQNPSTYEDLTVLENLEISYPEQRGVVGSLFFNRDRPLMDKIGEMAGQIYLSDHLHEKAGSLSHGQKQWLEIGMLLMQDPKLLLLDEPVAGMSPRERELTAELLNRVSQGRSTIVIEHDMVFVRMIAHRVTVMHQGKVLAEGSMEEVQHDGRVIEVYLGH
jgi:urea transport system ATP-binding protein